MEGPGVGSLTEGLLLQTAAADGHVLASNCEVQLIGASCQRLVYTREPGPGAAQLHTNTAEVRLAAAGVGRKGFLQAFEVVLT